MHDAIPSTTTAATSASASAPARKFAWWRLAGVAITIGLWGLIAMAVRAVL